MSDSEEDYELDSQYLSGALSQDEALAMYKRAPGSAPPKHVKLHPRDNGDGLEPWFFEGACWAIRRRGPVPLLTRRFPHSDPHTFVPLKNRYGEVRSWGVIPCWKDGNVAWEIRRNMPRQVRRHIDTHTLFV